MLITFSNSKNYKKKIHRVFIFAIAVSAFFENSILEASPLQENYQEGVNADRRGNLTRAIRHWRNADPSIFMFGACQEQGFGTPKNLDQAYKKYARFANPEVQNFENPLDPAHYRTLLQNYRLGINALINHDPDNVLNDPYRLFIVGKCFQISSLWHRNRRNLNLKNNRDLLPDNGGQRLDGGYGDNTVSGRNAPIFNALYLTDPDLMMAEAFFKRSAQGGCSFAKFELGIRYDHKLSYLESLRQPGIDINDYTVELDNEQIIALQSMLTPQNLERVRQKTRTFYQNILDHHQNNQHPAYVALSERAVNVINQN